MPARSRLHIFYNLKTTRRNSVIVGFFKAFALTALLECVLAAFMTRDRKTVICVFLCNLLTNPALNYILTLMRWLGVSRGIWLVTLGILEIAVVALEAGIMRYVLNISMKKAALLSLALNFCSFGAGVLIWGL